MYVINETYTDYNGVQRTEKFMFNFNKAEIMELEIGTAGGLAETIQAIVDAKDGPALITIFKELVLKAYGEKSPDGRRFIKSQQLRDEFSQTEAYSQIFMRLSTDDKEAAAFVNGIVPAELAAEAAKLQVKNDTGVVADIQTKTNAIASAIMPKSE